MNIHKPKPQEPIDHQHGIHFPQLNKTRFSLSEVRAAERLGSRFLVPTVSSLPLEEVWKASQQGCLEMSVASSLLGKNPVA